MFVHVLQTVCWGRCLCWWCILTPAHHMKHTAMVTVVAVCVCVCVLAYEDTLMAFSPMMDVNGLPLFTDSCHCGLSLFHFSVNHYYFWIDSKKNDLQCMLLQKLPKLFESTVG